ncbi:MAG: hypothetical protein ACXWKP_14670 [Bradyrhizobium sp.]|jgi:hypothetical protein
MDLTSIQMKMARDGDDVAPAGTGCADDGEAASIAGGRIVAGQIVRMNYTRNRCEHAECQMIRTKISPVEGYLQLSGTGA